MRKFKVTSDRIVGKNSKMFFKNQEITENDLNELSLARFISTKRIVELKDYSIPNNRKIRLAIVTSVWGRGEIFRLFCLGVEQLVKNCPDFEISLVVSGSFQQDNDKEGFVIVDSLKHMDNVLKHSEKNPKNIFIEIPNQPLAAKVNATTFTAGKLGVDYVLCMGSDDIVSPELLNYYGTLMRKGIDFIGVTDFYFYDTTSKRSLYWGGYRETYRKNHTAGAARALSARLLSEWDWMPWENKDSHVLDKSMQDKLKVTPHTIEVFSMKEKGFFAVDIKSSTNMTPFAKWDNSEFIDNGILKQQFKYIF